MQCTAHDEEHTNSTRQVSMSRIDLDVTGHNHLCHRSNAISNGLHVGNYPCLGKPYAAACPDANHQRSTTDSGYCSSNRGHL
jgi:hypothetical protein